MPAAFPGFPPEAMAFFRGLARNNRREWFLPRKHVFDESVKAPMVRLVEALNAALADFAPAYVTDPDKAIYRVYRDVRFSNDKTPYKTHIAASFTRRGLARHCGAGFYFEVTAKEAGVGGGIYLAPPESLKAVRRHFAERHEDFRRLIAGRALRKLFGEPHGERLSRVPKGWPADHPAADLLRYKQCYLWSSLDGGLATTPRLYTELLARFRSMAPFLEFLNEPLVAANRGAAGRKGLPLHRI
jgi:uncharacterized protein (TIGR02453 family)